MKKTLRKMYNLELNETMVLPDGTNITRVPSGWIYSTWDEEKQEHKDRCFVPFDNNYQPHEKG